MNPPPPQSDSTLAPPHSTAEEILEKKIEILETDWSSSLEFNLEDIEVIFEFNQLPIELKIMVWNEMSFLHKKGYGRDAYLAQQDRMNESRVSLEWYTTKGKPTKSFIGEEI